MFYYFPTVAHDDFFVRPEEVAAYYIARGSEGITLVLKSGQTFEVMATFRQIKEWLDAKTQDGALI